MINYRYIIIGLLFFMLAGCVAKPSLPAPNAQTGPIPAGKFYFHAKNCLHCAIVEKYMAENNIQQKLYFISGDVTSDKSAFDLMVAIGERCQIKQSDLGTPLFWDGQNCHTGDKEVISYFESLNQ